MVTITTDVDLDVDDIYDALSPADRAKMAALIERNGTETLAGAAADWRRLADHIACGETTDAMHLLSRLMPSVDTASATAFALRQGSYQQQSMI